MHSATPVRAFQIEGCFPLHVHPIKYADHSKFLTFGGSSSKVDTDKTGVYLRDQAAQNLYEDP